MSDTSGGELSENIDEWTQEQKDMYFGVNDNSAVEEQQLAQADVPDVDLNDNEEGGSWA